MLSVLEGKILPLRSLSHIRNFWRNFYASSAILVTKGRHWVPQKPPPIYLQHYDIWMEAQCLGNAQFPDRDFLTSARILLWQHPQVWYTRWLRGWFHEYECSVLCPPLIIVIFLPVEVSTVRWRRWICAVQGPCDYPIAPMTLSGPGGGGHGDSMHNVAQFSSEEKGTGEIIQAYQGIALMWVYAPTSTCKKCL